MQHLQDRWRLEMEAAQSWREHYVAQAAPPEQTQSHDHQHDHDYQYNHHHQQSNA